MAKKQPLTWTANVVRGGNVIPYESLTDEEKDALGRRLTRKSIESVARSRGLEVEFSNHLSGTVTA